MTGAEVCEYYRRLYGGGWSSEINKFGGHERAVEYFESLKIERLNWFSRRLAVVNRLFPALKDCVPSVEQVGLVLVGKFREAAGVPDLIGMIEFLQHYKGKVVLPLKHPPVYWFQTMAKKAYGEEWFEEMIWADETGRFVQKLKPIYKQVLKQVEAGHCQDYPQFVLRELARLDYERECRACFHRPRTDLEMVYGNRELGVSKQILGRV